MFTKMDSKCREMWNTEEFAVGVAVNIMVRIGGWVEK